eukprot:TRINITY_DN7386_c0_g1_i1.p1 TRINITY_DN7386_c0_g1~~TRINITY_DN7386_c0_g1_i1.p1  ORF type:complete len:311 (-),score=33.19 TRINITY_DN7386_c0_g1_i1:173-1048(-)
MAVIENVPADIRSIDPKKPQPKHSFLGSILAWLVWPAICTLPIVLTLQGGTAYRNVFPAAWYDEAPVEHVLGALGVTDPRTVKPLGLILGLLAVAVGQFFTVIYHAMRRNAWLGACTRIQTQAREYSFSEGLKTHLSQPEGFVLLGGYLIFTWMHFGEHKISARIYQVSHKPHHRFTNPRLFDAFDGSLTDTVCMILVPLVIVARLVPANVWSYMTFGTLYANWLVMIHSEFAHPWDKVFQRLGLGTAADHHVHHKLFVFNFGHLFMYWDMVFGTYRDPKSYAGKQFSSGI